MSEYKERKQCPFAFNNTRYNLSCLEEKCMAWEKVNEKMGYCYLIFGGPQE
jgi:hypothetical protein